MWELSWNIFLKYRRRNKKQRDKAMRQFKDQLINNRIRQCRHVVKVENEKIPKNVMNLKGQQTRRRTGIKELEF